MIWHVYDHISSLITYLEASKTVIRHAPTRYSLYRYIPVNSCIYHCSLIVGRSLYSILLWYISITLASLIDCRLVSIRCSTIPPTERLCINLHYLFVVSPREGAFQTMVVCQLPNDISSPQLLFCTVILFSFVLYSVKLGTPIDFRLFNRMHIERCIVHRITCYTLRYLLYCPLIHEILHTSMADV